MQVLANGLALGAIYALVASCLLLIFGILEIPDFALGGRIMVGGYAGYFVADHLGLHYWIAVIAAALAAGAMGVVSELAVYRWLRNTPSPLLSGFIGALVLLTATEITAQLLFTADFRKLPSPYESNILQFAGIRITEQRLLAGVVALVLIAALHAYLRGTRGGRAMRATLEDRRGAEIVGISPKKTAMIAMLLGSCLAGVAGALLGPMYLVYPTMGDNILIKGLIVIVLAGMRSSLGAISAALLLGIAESFGASYLSVGFSDAYAFIFLIIALMVRPNGLFTKSVLVR
ncbi:branched-chain amino acid ABC transporter permease [Sphaerisporangium krabiense]|uniref:Branched-chain amino acid transport system permease protein n=1 Tax=Sphaerisporangium krabiense TaxID=763782 RepID=A0A7W9DP05_9ACTN|nr:branched-chain amino acid ABC transporter permease [Sphaerisporangium krabiense]MBB5625883.1 branched-chain amino acid transport system permease protein [Sphaerisporangium krabiense]GII64685.1 branched-chain amino acid ABC transporter permease [Sphaerisporangium krabiense]